MVYGGCFHGYSDSVRISRTYAGFTVVHKDRQKKMTNDEANVIRDLEYNIQKVSKTFGGCTTSESYVFVFRGRRGLAALDSTCRYDFYTEFLSSLGI